MVAVEHIQDATTVLAVEKRACRIKSQRVAPMCCAWDKLQLICLQLLCFKISVFG